MCSSPKRVVLSQKFIREVETILEHHFSDPSLLAQALTHRSAANSKVHGIAFYENGGGDLVEVPLNNERLEILGDKVFGLLVTQSLFEREEMSEGSISTVSQKLLSGRYANNYFVSLGLSPYVLQAEELRGHVGSRHGDCFEALLAALFLDGGFATVSSFFKSHVEPLWGSLNEHLLGCHKRQLQEFLVSYGLPAPKVSTQINYVPVSFDSQTRMFTQGIKLFGRRVSIGWGTTRILADQTAAESLLERLRYVNATCFLIRLARNANDTESLAKLRVVRAAQVQADQRAAEEAAKEAAYNKPTV